MRYEDLVLEPERTVSEIMCLLLDIPTLSGTVCEQLVKIVCQSGFESRRSYALKPGTGQLNRHSDKYTPESIEDIKVICKRGLHFWGYVQNSEDPDNRTAFLTDFVEDETTEECNSLYKNYLQLNSETLAGLG